MTALGDIVAPPARSWPTPSDAQARVLREIEAWLDDPYGRQWKYLAGYAGVGKCLGRGTPVLMFDGSVKTVENILPGDRVMGPDSQPRNVLGLGRGRSPLYRITPTKGDSWVCNDEHILTLVGSKCGFYLGKTIDISVRDLLARWPDHPDCIWKLWRTGVSFPTAEQAVDPYWIGLWLGDGTAETCDITSVDTEIHDYCATIAPRYGLQCRVMTSPGKAPRIVLTNPERGRGRPGSNRLRVETRRCLDSEGRKRIPQDYLVADRLQRLALLAGLVDTDGHLTASNTYEIVTKSEPLRDGILYLARSLGFAAYSVECEKGIKSTGFRGWYHRITISGEIAEVPCRLPRKRATPRRQIKRVGAVGFKLEPIGVGDYYGFHLDGDGRFLLGDFTVTHNTTILRLLQASGRRVGYCSYTGKAAHVLRSKGCEGATTLHKLLYRPEETVVRGEDGSVAYHTEFCALPRDESPIPDLDVVCLDEVSMCDSRLATDLLSYGTRVLVTGDPFQLPPIAGEGYFTRADPDWTLTEVHRQARDSGILRLATDIREGRGIGAPDEYAPDCAVISIDEAAEQESDLLDWCDIVLVGTHRWRHHFNERYRERQGFQSRYPELGDQLVCLQNDHKRGLLNGSIWRCDARTMEAGHMKLELPVREVEGDRHAPTGPLMIAPAWAHDFVGEEAAFEKWPWRRRAERARFAYGYALTGHKFQGSEAFRVLALDESAVFREHAAQWLYTVTTRAAKQLVLVRR